MDNHTKKCLQFDSITEKLAKRCSFSLSKKKANILRPLGNIYEINKALSETEDAVKLLNLKGRLPIGYLEDVSETVGYAKKQRILMPAEILAVKSVLTAAKEVIGFTGDMRLPNIGGYIELLDPLAGLYKVIDKAILSEDKIADNASGKLADIRKMIAREEGRRAGVIRELAVSPRLAGALREQSFTVKNSKYVLPVKKDYRAVVKGQIIAGSASGETLFIEPVQILEISSKIDELFVEEENEIRNILKAITADIGANSDVILNNQELLSKLDFFMAKGRLALDLNAEKPTITENGEGISLVNAWHPEIEYDIAVKNDVKLPKGRRSLVITGPNTGGKTVILKATGLLVLMALSGLFITADSASVIPVMRVFADIGDEQSIAQSLSTFSAHLKALKKITDDAKDGDLVIIDEIGAGTDPIEGASLGIAIIKYLQKKNIFSLVSTHYTEVKKFAITDESIVSAAMEFDERELLPTYELRYGSAGKSNAFAIAGRINLNKDIIDDAMALITSNEMEFTDAIDNLYKEEKEAREHRQEALMIKLELKKKKEVLSRLENTVKAEKTKIIEEAKEEAREIIAEAREAAGETKKNLKRLKKSQEFNNREYADAVGKLRSASESIYSRGLEEPLGKNASQEHMVEAELKAGALVYVAKLSKNGRIVDIDSKGRCLVDVDGLKVRLPGESLFKPKKEETQRKKRRRDAELIINDAPSELNIIGLDSYDAMYELDKFLDSARLAGKSEVRIVHGKGRGILMNLVRTTLSKCNFVYKYRPGLLNEGGEGVTIVSFKK